MLAIEQQVDNLPNSTRMLPKQAGFSINYTQYANQN